MYNKVETEKKAIQAPIPDKPVQINRDLQSKLRNKENISHSNQNSRPNSQNLDGKAEVNVPAGRTYSLPADALSESISNIGKQATEPDYNSLKRNDSGRKRPTRYSLKDTSEESNSETVSPHKAEKPIDPSNYVINKLSRAPSPLSGCESDTVQSTC